MIDQPIFCTIYAEVVVLAVFK